MENLEQLVIELCKLPQENAWLEFKHNNWSPDMIGKDISALSNSAVLAGHSYAYMVWGVEDSSHEIIGTEIKLSALKKGNQELEDWLRNLLSKNVDFSFHSLEVEGKSVEMIIISKAQGHPVTFESIEYIRSSSYTKKLVEYPALQAQLWEKLRNERFEDTRIKTNLQVEDIYQLLDCEAYYSLMSRPKPSDNNSLHDLIEEGLVIKDDNATYSITALGAILFAKDLSIFPRIGRKIVRLVQYEGNNRLVIMKEEEFNEGYAMAFEKVVNYINILLPARENINKVIRQTTPAFPLPAIREAIANALIHQDFYMTGAGPVIEIFNNRVEVTNPGTPLIDIMRIIDNPPKSRNEKLASLMRRIGMCEELGRGWDRMVISCEMQGLPAPKIQIYMESTKVSLFSMISFSNISAEDKLWSAYLHACIKYIEADSMTNSSLRERFGVMESTSGSISRLIRELLNRNLIKPLDEETAPRYMRYIPIWG